MGRRRGELTRSRAVSAAACTPQEEVLRRQSRAHGPDTSWDVPPNASRYGIRQGPTTHRLRQSRAARLYRQSGPRLRRGIRRGAGSGAQFTLAGAPFRIDPAAMTSITEPRPWRTRIWQPWSGDRAIIELSRYGDAGARTLAGCETTGRRRTESARSTGHLQPLIGVLSTAATRGLLPSCTTSDRVRAWICVTPVFATIL